MNLTSPSTGQQIRLAPIGLTFDASSCFFLLLSSWHISQPSSSSLGREYGKITQDNYVKQITNRNTENKLHGRWGQITVFQQ